MKNYCLTCGANVRSDGSIFHVNMCQDVYNENLKYPLKKEQMIKKYVKKPIPVEVMQYTGFYQNAINLINWSKNVISMSEYYGSAEGLRANIEINTLEGVMRPSVGDYVVKGPAGEFWFVRKAIFEETYEEVK